MSSIASALAAEIVRQTPLICKSCNFACTIGSAEMIGGKARCPQCGGHLAPIMPIASVKSGRTMAALRQVDSQVAAPAPMPTADFDRC
jgi:hypothetical protein